MKNNLKEATLNILYKNAFEAATPVARRIELAKEYLEEASEITKIYLDKPEKEALLKEILEEVILPYRKIQALVDNPDIEEIMINSLDSVFVKYRIDDSTKLTPVKFNSMEELSSLVEKLLEGSGRKVDWSHPMVDARLPNGSRINIVSKPLITEGFCITIRKFPTSAFTLSDLENKKTISPEIAKFFTNAIQNRLNILIVGGTASGKTTLLSGLIGVLSEKNARTRVVVIEETTEIFVPPTLVNTISLETRLATGDNERTISIRDLVKNSLRMRPERIVIGELRGEEAFDFLQAANTGHPGSLTTIHANSVNDAVKRLEALVILAGFSQLPLATINTWIRESIDLIVFVERMDDNKRRVTEISGVQGNNLLTLFKFESNKFKKNAVNISKFAKSITKKRK